MPAKFLGEGMACDGPPADVAFTDRVVVCLFDPAGERLIERCCEWIEGSTSTRGEYDWNLVNRLIQPDDLIETRIVFYFTDPNTAFEFKIRFGGMKD